MQHAREAGQGAVHFEYVADGDNAHGGIGAHAHVVEPAELVVVQPETRGLSKKQALSEGIDRFGLEFGLHTREARQGAVHFERLGELEDPGHVVAVVGQVVVVQPACTGRGENSLL